jgi:EpsD family peptidyl-prolyl cis-trans isomerase
MRTKLWRPIVSAILATLLVAGLAACGSKKESKPVSQVAAQVNAEEISVHQINFVLGRSNVAIPPEQASLARREVLDRLIDQQLAVEQAIERKLDRTPETVMAIDAGRREILARAYVEHIAARQAKPTQEEAEKYIAEHPQLFAERRIFNIQELALPAASQVAPALREMVAAGKSMDDIAKWLRGKDIKFSGGSATRPAEQVALDVLPKLHALKD